MVFGFVQFALAHVPVSDARQNREANSCQHAGCPNHYELRSRKPADLFKV